MIAIVSSNLRERSAFGALCEYNQWPFFEFDSIQRLARVLHSIRPNVILVRHKLSDGYSDDLIALRDQTGLLDSARLIVLIGAGSSSAQETRQIVLGADVVLRDPIRTDVVHAYLARFRVRQDHRFGAGNFRGQSSLSFAGATIDIGERTMRHAGQMVTLAPKEIELVQILFESPDEVVPYNILYSEILGRRYGGDTSNMRVLLGKLGASFRAIGLVLGTRVSVIPKTGYRYVSKS